MATNTGKQSMQQSSQTEPPFWRLPGAAAGANAVGNISPDMTLPMPPPPPPALAIIGGNTYSTAIVETSAAAAVAATVLPISVSTGQQQPPPVSTAAASAAAVACQFCRLSNGSCRAATTTITTSCLGGGGAAGAGASGPRWMDRRNLTELQEAELQGKIRNLVVECEKKHNGFLGITSNKKLLLEGMSLSEADIPVEDILLGVDYRDKHQRSLTTVAPQWIKAAQAASKKNKASTKAGPLDSYGTQATTASSVLSTLEGRSNSTKGSISSGGGGGSAGQHHSSLPLAKTLHTLSLSRNRYLLTIPQKLVSGSMVSGAKLVHLKHLDLSSCAINKLPDERMWDLPQLKTLNLALNRLQDFPNQNVLGGLPQLKELNLYGNRLSEICHFPQGCSRNNSKLVLLNVAFNDLVCLPETLPFPRLESLIASHNFLAVIPQALVLSSSPSTSSSSSSNKYKSRPPRLRHLDVTSNPVTEPPAEVCERGLNEMRRYYKMNPQQQQDSSSRRASGTTRRSSQAPPRHSSRDFDKQRGTVAARSSFPEASSSGCMHPLFDLMGGDQHDDDDCLAGQQEEPQDVNVVFQQQLQQHSLQQQGLLSRRPSHEVPLFISVASTLAI